MSHILEVRGLQVAFAGERGNTIGTDRIDFLWIRERRSVW